MITGPSGTGKSRLALEASANQPLSTVASLDPEVSAIDLLKTQGHDHGPVVIIDNLQSEKTSDLIAAALGDGPKLVLTVTDPSEAQQFNFGQDARIKVFSPNPLSEEHSRELLHKAGANLDYSVESWVTQKAGGNPSILIAAAAIGASLRLNGPTFLDQVGSGLETRARRLLSDKLMTIVRSLSIMTAVGAFGNAASELDIVCAVLGDTTPNDVLSNVVPLLNSGFVRKIGNYLQVTPPVFANRAAATALAGRGGELTGLLRLLAPKSRSRLLRRVQQLPAATLEAFIKELFEQGAFQDFATALNNAELLHALAPVASSQVAKLVEDGLSHMSVEIRQGRDPGIRRELVWTLEELLFRRMACSSAVRCLRLLAEAETERYSNNATGTFTECFNPFHPQVPLTLEERLKALRELLAEGMTSGQKMLAIQAAASAFDSSQISYFRRSEGAEPFDAVPTITYAEAWDYQQEVIEELQILLQDQDDDVRRKAGQAWVRGIAEFTIRARPSVGIQMLTAMKEQVVLEAIPVTLQDYVDALNFAHRGLEGQRDRFQKEFDQATQLVDSIETGAFDTRVRRWVGTWDYGEQEADENGDLIFHGQLEIRRLAKSAAADTNSVSEDLFRWLRSEEAKRASEFFYFLGRDDPDGKWQSRINYCASGPDGELAFACYYGGRGHINCLGIEDKLDTLTSGGKVRGEALLGATSYLPGSSRGVRRVLTLLDRGVDPRQVERRLMAGGWMRPLTIEEGSSLLTAIAGSQLEHAELVIDFLAMWIHNNKVLEGSLAELTWRALESAPTSGEAWDFDLVAAALVPSDLNRAFALLESLLTLKGEKKSWEPLDRHGGNRFWNALWTADRRRALELLLRLGGSSPLLKWRISWHIPDILDLEADRDFLRDFSQGSLDGAEFLSSCLAAGKPGFWQVALDLLESYPDNRIIRRNVAAAATHMNHTIVGPMSQHYEACAKTVENIAGWENLPDATRTFLRNLVMDLRKEAGREQREEEDESVEWS